MLVFQTPLEVNSIDIPDGNSYGIYKMMMGSIMLRMIYRHLSKINHLLEMRLLILEQRSHLRRQSTY